MRHLFLLILPIILSAFSVSFAQDIPLGDVPICAPEANPTSPGRYNQLLYISAGFEPNFEGGGEGEPEPIWGDAEAERNVFLIDTETGSERKIADGFSRAYWSPDGQKLALIRDTGISEDLYLLDFTVAAEPDLLLSTSNIDGGSYHINSINWFSDGQKIIFSLDQANPLKNEAGQKSGIYTLNLKTKQMQPLLLDDILDARYPALSPDGTQIAFLGFATDGSFTAYLNLMNIDGSNPHRLLDSEIFTSPVWSPDSREIGYLKKENGPALYAVDVADEQERFLARSTIGPSWSPDGKYTLFSPISSGEEIYRMDSDGGASCLLADHESELKPLTGQKNTESSSLNTSIGGLTWSADAERLAYTFDVSVGYYEPKTGVFWGEEPLYSQVWTIKRDGTDRRLLLSEPVSQIVWRPKVGT